LFLVGWKLVGLKSLLLVQLPITLMAGAAGMWLFYIQHQFEDTYWERHEEWSFHKAGIEGSSFYDLGAFLHWFTGNIGYHHIHHLASRVPNYRLRECFKNVTELHEVTVLSIPSSFHCATLKLWDEEIHRLISFRDLRSSRA
jgi:omega-6 fatty acid desaturase (delta-12 desaturase)